MYRSDHLYADLHNGSVSATCSFGISGVVALVHDVLVVLAFYAFARVSVGNTFIACMLTIVGYSINATIVIFDRVRENMTY